MKTQLLSIFVLIAVILAACGTAVTSTPPQSPSISVPTTQAPSPTPPQAPAATNNEVKINISGFKFDPATVTTKVGTKVTWTNQDSSTHSVVADDGSWASDSLAKGATYSQTFDKAGTYKYSCGIHASMKGSIVVEP